MKIKTGAFKKVYIYDNHVIVKMTHNCGDEWLRFILERKLIEGTYDYVLNQYDIEKLNITFKHNDIICSIRNAGMNNDFDEVLSLFKLHFPSWYNAIIEFMNEYGGIVFDWKNQNIGYREDGTVVFFDLFNPTWEL